MNSPSHPPWATLRGLMASTRKGTAAEARLLRLATWLSSRAEPVTRREIYEAFPDDFAGKPAAREKKWTRDKLDLRRLGIPVQFLEEEGAEGAYLVEASACTLPHLQFTPEEGAVVWTAGQAALRTHDHPLSDDLETALRKLAVGAKGLPPRAALIEADWTVPEPATLRRWLGTLADALERQRRVKVAYRKADRTVTERHVDVYGYAWRRGHWIFAGHCHLRGSVRVFYLERVQSLSLAPAQGKKVDYEIPGDFDIRAWSRQETWNYFVHEPLEAVVRFRGSLAALAPKLLPGASFTREPDNSRLARLVVRNLDGLVRQALAWGPEAELVEPARGRGMAREILASLSDRLARESAR
jgi:predicted DNA-binding transcriptional regulator YafY